MSISRPPAHANAVNGRVNRPPTIANKPVIAPVINGSIIPLNPSKITPNHPQNPIPSSSGDGGPAFAGVVLPNIFLRPPNIPPNCLLALSSNPAIQTVFFFSLTNFSVCDVS